MSIILNEYEKFLSTKTLMTEHVTKRNGKWVILNKDRTKILEDNKGKGFPSKKAADKRMRQIEYFKNEG